MIFLIILPDNVISRENVITEEASSPLVKRLVVLCYQFELNKCFILYITVVPFERTQSRTKASSYFIMYV